MIDFSQNVMALHWAEDILGVSFQHTPAVWLTQHSSAGTILGVVVFSRFTTGNCEITVASKGPWLSRDLAFAVGHYVFNTQQCRRVTAIIAVENAKSLKLAQRLGFRIEGTLRDWFPTGDAHVLGFLAEDLPKMRILKDFYGQPEAPGPT